MFQKFALLLVVGSVICFIYGIIKLHVEVEPNTCRMTYMFGQPNFAPVKVDANDDFPNYKLFWYYEGKRQHADPLKMRMIGAPVLFVPGNAGSYKQVRSLASVALRKAMETPSGLHLDYYTIDYNEEFSGLFGGYLYHQQTYLKHCIRTVLSLYKNNPSIVLIGHSMGGKLAQSILTDLEIAQHINTIISISTPLDKPVLNLDSQMGLFYQQTNDALMLTRSSTEATTTTNMCCGLHQKLLSEQQMEQQDHSARLDNVLLISTGGGNRDLLVHAGLTSSKFNDIHAMTTAIPRVTLSCDHLSAVWCLQFMQVINRFLFSIAQVLQDKTTVFKVNKAANLKSATGHFVRSRFQKHNGFVHFKPQGNWNEERRLVVNKFFSNGLKTPYYELISILQREPYEKLVIEALNVDDDDWLFGCRAQTHNETNKLYCEKGTPLHHLIQKLPNGDREARSLASLDLHRIRRTYIDWTHLLIRLPPANKRIGYNLDIFDAKERMLDIRMPRWYSLEHKAILNTTLQGSLFYKLRISDLNDPYQSLRVHIEAKNCIQPNYHITTKLCVPWAAGFERYSIITSPDQQPSLFVNVPTLTPRQYNTTVNPVTLDIYLDPICRYSITYNYAHDNALSRLVQQFSGWLPAHLCCVLFIVLKNQVDIFQLRGSFRSLKPYIGFFQFSSLYIVTGCRLFKKLLLKIRLLPTPEMLDYSINISFVIHSAAIVLSIIGAFAVWLALMFYGNAIHRIALRLTRLSEATSNIMVSIMTNLPITFGILTMAVAVGSFSGVALLVAFSFYFLMLSNAYKDYLEDFLLQKAANLLNLGGSKTETTQASATEAAHANTTNEVDVNEFTPLQQSLDDSEPNSDVENSLSEENDSEDEEAQSLQTAEADEKPELCEGLQNFPFHITLLLMLFMLVLLNGPATFAWLRSRSMHMPDPSLVPSLIVLASLSLLLQLKAPQKCPGYWTMSVMLYLCSGICLLYCQESIYRLNFTIAFGFALLAAHQSLCLLWRVVLARFF